ncbi:MAG: acyl-CoA/acyl-ACP dehydrogenase [Deltaproteobacteria bacterium]|nr:acyl-CoA/acyl-ACP dehydrogenase [Deltaproteobacteria bacterium]MBW2393582.1 acyl-CoA/acyl-ACP dehydrogenase [Deltaproteobacteria bacterium]
MDFEWSEDQREIVGAVEQLLAEHAGPARAIALDAEDAYDHELEQALDEAGFLDVALAEETGFLEAALVVEAVARAAGVASIGASAIVAPGLLGERAEGPVALARVEDAAVVPIAAHARTLLVDAGDEARRIPLASGDAEPVRSGFMIPVARPRMELTGGESLGPGSGARLRRYWQLALAAEASGLMAGALDVTVEYVKQRRQFKRPIGSFQAIQHRLAICQAGVQSVHWLMLEAAAWDAADERAALAATRAATVAQQVFIETHQMTGAMGFTREHDLHVWSMRLQPLIAACGGPAAHPRAAAQARWGV